MRNLKTRIIELSVNNRAEVIELPVNPPEVEFTEKQLNQTITLLNIGEANLKGERGLKYTKFSGFFQLNGLLTTDMQKRRQNSISPCWRNGRRPG